MIEKLTRIEIGNKKLPIRCDLQVLSAIQDEFESLTVFEQKIIGLKPKKDEVGRYIYKEDGTLDYSVGEPSLKAVAFALPLFIHEGIEKAIEQGEDIPELNWKASIDEVDFNYVEVALALYQEFQRCFRRKKKTNLRGTRKNQKMEE